MARHWQPVESTYIKPFTTSRMSTVRLPPPRIAGGISGSISAHSSSGQVAWIAKFAAVV